MKPLVVHGVREGSNHTSCGMTLDYAGHVSEDWAEVSCMRCQSIAVGRSGRAADADSCGAGTIYGCKQRIGDQYAHIVVNARPGDNPHVMFHIGRGCCPCETPGLTRPAFSEGLAAEMAREKAKEASRQLPA